MSSLTWAPTRIPVQDALVAFVPKGIDGFAPPRPVYEVRWFEQSGSCRVVIPYDGGPFDTSVFQIDKGGWDHVTCELCNIRIPAMTLCYVTMSDEFQVLCERCYEKMVVGRPPLRRSLTWRVKRWFGHHSAA